MPTYKDEDRGTWYTSFYYTDWMGNRKKKKKEGFKRQKDAQTWERNFLSKQQGSPDMTFNSLVELYLEDCKSRLKPTTLENKTYIFGNRITPYFKELPINKIDAVTIQKWQNELLSHENKFSQTYLKTLHNQVSAIFNFAVKYYNLPTNPARLSGSIGKKHAESMAFWTIDEFNTFLPYVSDKLTSLVAFSLLFYTGIRSGEMLALTLNDFDFTAQTLSINKNYARHEGKDLILAPKTPKSKRVITLPKFLCELVQHYANKLYDYTSVA
jgi:integrase